MHKKRTWKKENQKVVQRPHSAMAKYSAVLRAHTEITLIRDLWNVTGLMKLDGTEDRKHTET